MMGIRDSAGSAPIPVSIQHHPRAPGHDAGPTWLEGQGRGRESRWDSPSRAGALFIGPIFQGGDLDSISHKGTPFKRGLLDFNHFSPHVSPILSSWRSCWLVREGSEVTCRC